MTGSFAGRFVAWLLCPALALGQAVAPSATFQITSRIVYVDVVVRDRSGHIVRGLTEKDFRVVEDGKDQKVDYFRDHTHDPAPAATGREDSGEFSNVAPGSEALSSVNIILFDFFNTAPQDYLYARKQMIRFLEKLPPGRQTALFVLGTRLEMLQGFTGSTDRLLAAAKAMQLGTSIVETVGEQQQDGDLVAALGKNPSGTSALAQMFMQAHGQDEIRAHDITKTALDQLAAAVSGYPGRKNLYWLGETFPVYGGPVLELNDAAQSMIDNTMSTADMAEANRAEATAQIAIYPISLMGLDASGMGPEAAGMTSSQTLFTQRNAMREMLNNLADATGGQAYYGTNDFAGALARGFEDGSSYYSLAYRPANHNWNGHYRNIAVKLAERGYSLSYRRGYYALPGQPATAANAGAVMTAALQPDTPEETMLLLKARVELPNAAHPAVRVDSVIDPGNVSFRTDAQGRRHARLLVTLEAVPDPAPGAKAAGINAPQPPPQESGMYVVNVDETAFQKLFTAGMPAHQEMKLAPGRYRLRLGVCDLSNLRIGTLDMAVVVNP
jgi:VWFA-related protein